MCAPSCLACALRCWVAGRTHIGAVPAVTRDGCAFSGWCTPNCVSAVCCVWVQHLVFAPPPCQLSVHGSAASAHQNTAKDPIKVDLSLRGRGMPSLKLSIASWRMHMAISRPLRCTGDRCECCGWIEAPRCCVQGKEALGGSTGIGTAQEAATAERIRASACGRWRESWLQWLSACAASVLHRFTSHRHCRAAEAVGQGDAYAC
jgi:hypothetical protein